MAVGAIRTGGINARPKSLGRAEEVRLKGFRASEQALLILRGNGTLFSQVPAVGEGCVTLVTLPSSELIGFCCSNSGG